MRRAIDLSGTLLGGRYRLLRRIGVGSVGSLYESIDESSLGRRRVAVKVLHAELTGTEVEVARFKREARIAMQLEHPHVAKVLEFVAAQGEPPFLVTEYLAGQTLHELLKTSDGHRITPVRAVRMALQVLSALDAAHQQGVIHRDIKPENVFLVLQAHGMDLIKVLDFGSAKLLGESTGVPLTITGMVIGTLSYMPPEQALAKRIDHRADLYALAATLFAAISGERLFAAATPAETLEAVQHTAPPSLQGFGVDAKLDAILRKGLHKEPFARYQNAAEMELDLRQWMDTVPPEEAAERHWSIIPPRLEADVLEALTPRKITIPPPVELPIESDAHPTLEGVSVDAAARVSSAPRGSSAVDLAMPAVGHMFGRYRILAELGAGGVSEVFRAEDTAIRRHVALKVLRVARDASGTGVTVAAAERILREARIAATIDHPNAISIFDVDTHGGIPYLVMELVEGRSFRDLVRDRLALVSHKVTWLIDVARSLSAAHKKGIVHRDIKPENVMLRDADQVVKVLDFGIAQRLFEKDVTEAEVTERIPGTPAYMAPEQMYGEEATALSDQFAWGVFAYELLAGSLPWVQRGGMLHLVHQILTRVPEAPSRRRSDVPAEVDAVVMRALSKNPEDRYPSMDAAIAALVGAWVASLVTTPEADDEVTVKRAAPRGVSRWRRRVAMATVAAAALVVGGAAVRESGAPRTQVSAGAADSVDSDGTTLSVNGEAVGEYRAGLAAMHDAAGGAARKHLERATTLDPSFAAAHLRRVLATPWVGEAERASVRKAAQLRDALGEHDRALLQAIEPWVGVPQDAQEVDRRLTALAAAHPNDADTLYQLCRFRVLGGSYAQAIEACRAAEQIDPKFAGAVWLEAQSRLFLGDTASGSRNLDRCLALSAASTSCLNDAFQLKSNAGACSQAVGYAERLVALEPEDGLWIEQLGTTSYAVGKPIAAVRAAYERASDWSTSDQASVQRTKGRTNLALLTGDFDEATNQLDAWERGLAGTNSEQAHAELFHMRALVQRELGEDATSVGRAQGFLASRAAWAPSVEGDSSLDAQIVLYRSGVMARSAFVAARTAWLEAERARPQGTRGRFGMNPGDRWVTAYADAVVNPLDAVEALAALPAYQPLPGERYRTVYEDEAIGRAFLLAGRAEEALPFLRRASSSCKAAAYPMQHTWAHLELGHALESTDVSGACAAYKVVIDRWAVAARSSSARRASERWAALGCR